MKRLGIMILLCLLALTGISFAEVQTAPAPQKIDSGDTAWMLVSTALVMLMTPGLAFFYGGMVRKKNTLSIITQCIVILALISVQWVLIGYSLSFGPDINGIIGGLDFIGLPLC